MSVLYGNIRKKRSFFKSEEEYIEYEFHTRDHESHS